MLREFYRPDVISEARNLLFNNVISVDLPEKPHDMPAKREGEQQTMREIDDIIWMAVYIDRNNIYDKLPKYVAFDLSDLPIYGGFSVALDSVLTRVDTLDKKLADTLAAITQQLNEVIQSVAGRDVTSRDSTVCQPAEKRVTNRRVGNNYSHSQNVVVNERSSGCSKQTMSVIGTNSASDVERDTAAIDWTSIREPTTSWAAAMSTPHAGKSQAGNNRQSVGDSGDELPFTEVLSRRALKRLRQQSAQSPLNANAVNEQSARSRRVPLVYGKATTTNPAVSGGIRAPKSFVRKAVYCVDNVDTIFTADNVRDFVSAMSVRVISCFEVKPRKRRSAVSHDRKAFRLCIKLIVRTVIYYWMILSGQLLSQFLNGFSRILRQRDKN
jgi:hypothetical protein